MVGAQAENGDGRRSAQFRNIAGVAIQHGPSNTCGDGGPGDLRQSSATDGFKNNGVRPVTVGSLDNFEDLSALGDGVVVRINDLDFHAQFAGHLVPRIGLLSLVMVLVPRKRNQKAQPFHGGSTAPLWTAANDTSCATRFGTKLKRAFHEEKSLPEHRKSKNARLPARVTSPEGGSSPWPGRPRGRWDINFCASRGFGLSGRSWANAFRRHHAGAFQDGIELVSRQIRERVQFSRGPANFDAVDFGGGAQTEMQTKIVLRQVTAAAVDLVALRDAPGDDFDSCADCEAVALRSRQFETDPVAAIDALILQDHGSAVDIADHDVDIPGVEKIADGETAGYSLLEQRGPRLVTGITKRTVLLVHAKQLRLAISGAGRQRIHLRVNVACHPNQSHQAIVIEARVSDDQMDAVQ